MPKSPSLPEVVSFYFKEIKSLVIMGSNAKERKSLAIEVNEFECVNLVVLPHRATLLQTAGNFGDGSAPHCFFMRYR